MARAAVLVAVLVLLAAGCAADDAAPVPTLFDDSGSTSEAPPDESTSTTVTTTTAPISTRLPELATDVAGAVRSGDGTLRAILGTDGEVWNVRGACRATAVEPAATAEVVGPQHVVLDPAGGGAGDPDDDRLLALAEAVAAELRGHGIAVELTRTTDAPLSAATRGAAGGAVGARALVTLALGDAGAATASPRPVANHQVEDPESRRLGGLLHEHLTAAMTGIGGDWAALRDVGVRPLLNQRGENYFVVLESSAGTPAVRLEVMAGGPRETALLDDEEGRSTIAAALAEAIGRFLVTDEVGDGYVDPEDPVRQAPTSNSPGGCG